MSKEIAARLVQAKVALDAANERLTASMDALMACAPGAAAESRQARRAVDEAIKELKDAMRAWKHAADEK